LLFAGACFAASPSLLLQAPSASSASPTTLSYGIVVANPLQSMADLNQINSVNMLSLGILPSFGSALWIRPFIYLPANDSYTPELVTSYQTFPENNTYIVHLRQDTGWS